MIFDTEKHAFVGGHKESESWGLLLTLKNETDGKEEREKQTE
jgi:hypothetical protein